ncbi:hypothetical protein DL766_003039 [Monosporascus sp. MC13-8B]|uniref:Chromo domain-containing protein n=1 Tax=Monosporascus cannonballus TaxID=155416 RepID=A0ABY0H813_9PEZI|nr:hypothetical protein DL762_004708 [Monosporascus cannonballus]RYO98759.1 hypothetical protein DL763_002020 [Monosporascus cannonballus]RYP34390.1 hypothetical protein DL766_003039 [Monosporascus sp. MC13-8B]
MASESSSLFITGDGGDAADDDDISITSTDYGPEDDFEVEELLHERENPDAPGGVEFLIKWAGYPIDQCTWEPRHHLGDGVYEGWEETKAEIKAGRREPFDIQVYHRAIQEASLAKAERHRRRNYKRMRLGFPPTEPLPEHFYVQSPTEVSAASKDGSDHEAEAVEVDEIDPGRLPTSPPRPVAQKVIKQKTFQGIPSARIRKDGPAESGRASVTPPPKLPSKSLSKPSQGPIPKPRPSTTSTITGYQGTARPPITRKRSTSTDARATKSTSGKPPTQPAKASSSIPPSAGPSKSSSLRDKFSGKKATRTPQANSITSVFTDGKQRQRRKTLADVMADPTKDPKQFSNMRIQNIARKRGIEMNDAAPLNVSSIPAAFILGNEQAKPKGLPGNQTGHETKATTESPTSQATPIPDAASANAAADTIGAAPGKKRKKSVRFQDNAEDLMPVSVDNIEYASPESHSTVPETSTAPSSDAETGESASALQNVAEHMRRRSSGLHLAKSEYSILVYPSKCDGWEGLVAGQVPESPTESPLRYLIFKSPMDIRQYPTNPNPPEETLPAEDKSTIERLVKLMMDLDFSQMTTHNPKDKDNQVFMLVFPPEDTQLLRVVTLWLRSCQPTCRIFTSEIKGSFAKFLQHTTNTAGTVIFHEEVTTRIRRVPYVWEMIDRGKSYTFWNLATGRRTPPRYPSRVDFDLKPGQHCMTRLFPSGRAFLITPSFVISDPKRFYDFMHWFSGFCHNARYLIAIAADFPSWLHDLCMEKSQEMTRFYKEHEDEPLFGEFVQKYGLTKDRLDALARAWQILRKIMTDFGDEEAHIDVRRVMWAPREINPNDEQSLVNWFFWWSTVFLDRHRRFYVLGSNAKYKDRAYRTVRVPNYAPDQILNLNELQEKNRAKKETEEAQILAFWEGQAEEQNPGAMADTDSHSSKADNRTTEASTNVSPIGGRASLTSQNGRGFLSRLFNSDRADELQTWLRNLNKEMYTTWSTPFWQPVSWRDIPMADHFGDHRCDYANFTHWLSRCAKFRRVKNTWAGLFYTPDGDWDPAKPASSYKRHPWIAALRPVNPHFNEEGWAATELLIWDLSVGREADLSGMQIRLINFVRGEISKVAPEYFLHRVWFSNRRHSDVSGYDHPLDITCVQLRAMLGEARIWLPPFDGVLRARGWTELPLSYVSDKLKEDENPIDSGGHQQPFPTHFSDEAEPVTYVWLPPRGTTKQFRCYNDLYEAAYQNRVKDSTCREFRYSYRPTLEWYEEQKKEGRHCTHVCVDAADRIMAKLPRTKSGK